MWSLGCGSHTCPCTRAQSQATSACPLSHTHLHIALNVCLLCMYLYNVFSGDCELRGLGNPEIRSQGYLHMALHQKSYWLWQVRHITYLNNQVATHEFQGWGHPWKGVPCSCRDLSPSQTWALPWHPLTPPPLQLCDIRKVMALTLSSPKTGQLFRPGA